MYLLNIYLEIAFLSLLKYVFFFFHLQVATILSQNPDILGVIGHYASDVTLATAKIYQSSQLVAISPISTSVAISNMSPYIFRTVPSDYIAAANFSPVDSLQQAMNGGAEVIMLAVNTEMLDQALQVIAVNRQRLNLLGGDGVYNPKTLQIAGEFAEDMVLAIPWHIRDNLDTEFAQISRQLWRGQVNWRTAMAYDATMALAAAIDRSRGKTSLEPTRIGIQEVLSNPNFSILGANNSIRFSASGDRIMKIDLVKIKPTNGNSFNYEFVPIPSHH